VAEIQGKDEAVHCIYRCMPIIRIIGRKSCTEIRSELFLVTNHEKPTGVDIISTSQCVENYFRSI
jgi:hypothetical protein